MPFIRRSALQRDLQVPLERYLYGKLRRGSTLLAIHVYGIFLCISFLILYFHAFLVYSLEFELSDYLSAINAQKRQLMEILLYGFCALSFFGAAIWPRAVASSLTRDAITTLPLHELATIPDISGWLTIAYKRLVFKWFIYDLTAIGILLYWFYPVLAEVWWESPLWALLLTISLSTFVLSMLSAPAYSMAGMSQAEQKNVVLGRLRKTFTNLVQHFIVRFFILYFLTMTSSFLRILDYSEELFLVILYITEMCVLFMIFCIINKYYIHLEMRIKNLLASAGEAPPNAVS